MKTIRRQWPRNPTESGLLSRSLKNRAVLTPQTAPLCAFTREAFCRGNDDTHNAFRTEHLSRDCLPGSPDAPADKHKQELPVAWVRKYRGANGVFGRVFTTTHGASEDILNPGFRRMLINATLWCAGLEAAVEADSDVGLVGPYQPVTFGFEGFVKGVKPHELSGWESPILPKKQSARSK